MKNAFFFPKSKTVDSVLSAFNQVITDLTEVEQREAASGVELEQHAKQMLAQADAAMEESTRARLLINRLNALVAA